MMNLTYSSLSEIGLVRQNNEDAWNIVTLQQEIPFFVVSDGVGGSNGGEVASHIVVEMLPILLDARIIAQRNPLLIALALRESLAELCRLVRARSVQTSGLRGMAATVVCGLMTEMSLVLGHMGDSRCYRYREGFLEQLTKDHSVVQALVDLGEISEEEAATHPAAGRITQAIGMEHEPLPEVTIVDLQPRDRFLFCSDGLHGMIDSKRLAALLAAPQDTKAVCQTLVQAAIQAGGKDNITVVIVDYNAPGETS